MYLNKKWIVHKFLIGNHFCYYVRFYENIYNCQIYNLKIYKRAVLYYDWTHIETTLWAKYIKGNIHNKTILRHVIFRYQPVFKRSGSDMNMLHWLFLFLMFHNGSVLDPGAKRLAGQCNSGKPRQSANLLVVVIVVRLC